MEEEAPAVPGMKNQIIALLTLLPVLGILWLVVQYLPALGDWMGKAVDEVVTTDEASKNEDQEKPPEPDIGEKPFGVSSDPLQELSVSTTSYREQIIEQMGGADLAEVRHLAISDDQEKMVVALQITDTSGERQLIEVFFERDEFGRYLSTADSPVETQLKIWSE